MSCILDSKVALCISHGKTLIRDSHKITPDLNSSSLVYIHAHIHVQYKHAGY